VGSRRFGLRVRHIRAKREAVATFRAPPPPIPHPYLGGELGAQLSTVTSSLAHSAVRKKAHSELLGRSVTTTTWTAGPTLPRPGSALGGSAGGHARHARLATRVAAGKPPHSAAGAAAVALAAAVGCAERPGRNASARACFYNRLKTSERNSD
jgi:hypothetical protein